jgi:hypothetical protein
LGDLGQGAPQLDVMPVLATAGRICPASQLSSRQGQKVVGDESALDLAFKAADARAGRVK